MAAIPEASGSMSMSKSKTFLLGGDILVNRLWGDAPDGRGDLGLAA